MTQIPYRPASEEEKSAVERAARLKKHRAHFYADESLRRPVVDVLRTRGMHVETAEQAGLRRRADEDQVAHARRSGKVLLSEDRDFLNRVRFPLIEMPATVVFGFGDASERAIRSALMPLAAVWRFPDFFDRWIRIDAHVGEWSEEVRFLDGSSQHRRLRYHKGRVEEWADDPIRTD